MDLDWKVHIRPFPGAPRGGDLGLVISLDDGALVALIDATGHGLAAYAVAQTARNTLLNSHSQKPDELLSELHTALSGSIGAAISIARIHHEFLEFAGVGNVNALVGDRSLVVRAGIVGQRMRTPHLVRAAFPLDTWLLLYTDGVSQPKKIPHGNAETVANSIIDTLASDHDDAAVALARWRSQV